jgi:hypothetical protein
MITAGVLKHIKMGRRTFITFDSIKALVGVS